MYCSFRHFFNHRFHDAIVEQTASAADQLRSDSVRFSTTEETGAVSVAASTMCTSRVDPFDSYFVCTKFHRCFQCEFELTIPEKVIASFARQREGTEDDTSDVRSITNINRERYLLSHCPFLGKGKCADGARRYETVAAVGIV